MDCLTLETLIENHEPVNLIDIRSRNEFRAIHIPGARCFPLADRVHSRILTAIFTLLEIVLVGLVIASLIAIAITSQVASYFPSVRFNASPNPQASRMIQRMEAAAL